MAGLFANLSLIWCVCILFGLVLTVLYFNCAIIDQIIADSGLFGLTVYTNEAGNSVLEFYYYGKPTDTDALRQFKQSADIIEQSAQSYGGRVKQTVHRAWFYAQPDIAQSWGAGFTIPYTDISGELYSGEKFQKNLKKRLKFNAI